MKTAFQNIRPPAFAGSFYPTDPEELRSTIEGYLRNVKSVNTVSPKAVIAPHAGYIYSGSIAASAFARFASARDVIRRVVLIGPGHRIPFKGLATTSADAWLTPLGAVPLDTEAIKHICALPHVRVIDDAHAGEHSLEVQLPFLQVVLGDFKIVPLVIGDASSEQVSEVAEALWGGEETRFVISSDLSHYHDYATARKLDLATARAIETLRPTDIGEEQACGRIGIRGLLRAAKRHQLRTHTLDLRNSGDTAGPRSQVVGYGAWDFVEERSVIEGRA